MCRTTVYRSPTCPHSWLELETSCRVACAADEENDLLTCPMFQDKAVTSIEIMPLPRQAKAPPNDCPQCDYDHYDIRDYRMCTAHDQLRHSRYGRKDWNRKGRGARPIPIVPWATEGGGGEGWGGLWLPRPPPPAYRPPQQQRRGDGLVIGERWCFVPSPPPKPKKHAQKAMREYDVDYTCCAVM